MTENQTQTAETEVKLTPEQTVHEDKFKDALAEYRTADAVRSTATVDVANATLQLVDDKVIPGFTGSGKRSDATFTMKQFAERLTAEGHKVSESNLIQWRNLGYCLRAGVKPDSDVWAALYNSGAKANSSAVTSVLKAPRPTAAKIAKAIEPKPQTRGNGNTSGTRKSPAKVAEAEVSGALDILAANLPKVSPAYFAKVKDRIAAVYAEAAKARQPKRGRKAA